MKLVFVILLTLLIALQINIWIKKDGYKQMKEIDYIKRDIKTLKKHLKNCITNNTMYLIPVLKNQLERLEQTKFNLEVEQYKDFF